MLFRIMYFKKGKGIINFRILVTSVRRVEYNWEGNFKGFIKSYCLFWGLDTCLLHFYSLNFSTYVTDYICEVIHIKLKIKWDNGSILLQDSK